MAPRKTQQPAQPASDSTDAAPPAARPASKSKAESKAAAPRKLLRVRDAFYLHWPPELKNSDGPDGSGRGGPGYIIDLNLPFERDWVSGQMHKLEAIHPRDQEGLEVGSIEDCPAARRMRLDALSKGDKAAPPVTVADAKEQTAADGADIIADGVMTPED